MMKDRLIRHYQWGIPIVLLAVAILGARLQCAGLFYALIGLICATVALVAFRKIDEGKYPYILFAIGLALLYQVTLMSNYLVGTDIHYEYYYANLVIENGYWDYTIPRTYNSALVTTALFPLVAKALNIDLVWLFKVIPPLFLAKVGVVMYLMFKRMIGNSLAFMSVFLFISVPTFFVELSGIAKQEIAELFFVVCFFLIIDRSLKLRMRWRLPIIAISAILTAVTHYTMGGALFYYLVIVLALLFVLRYVVKMQVQIPLRYFGLVIAIVVVLSGWYYGVAGGGEPLREIANRGLTGMKVIEVYFQRWADKKIEGNGLSIVSVDGMGEVADYGDDGDDGDTDEAIEEDDGKVGALIFTTDQVDPPTKYVKGFSKTMKAALGFDFMEVSSLGKVFRVLQYITQVLLIIGCIYLFVRRKVFPAEYLACCFASAMILFLCVVLPHFSPILNASRFYHVALIFLAPALILAGKLIFRDCRILVCCLLIPYFIFTSGVVFEVAKYESISTLEIPYSHSLSGGRVGSTGIYTEADGVVRQWIVDNGLLPIQSDMWGNIFLQDKLGMNRDDVVDFKKGKKTMPLWRVVSLVQMDKPILIPNDAYVFLREWNEENQKLIRYMGTGLRDVITYKDVDMKLALEGREVIFQCGKAKVYSPWH